MRMESHVENLNYNNHLTHLKNVESFKEMIKMEVEENNPKAFNLMSRNQKVKITSNKDGTLKSFDLIVKFAESETAYREVYSLEEKFTSEMYFYSKLLPTVTKLIGMPQLLDVFPKYYYGCLEPYNEMIILGDLSSEGFENAKNPLNLDLKTMQSSLNCVAKLHAAGIAYKWQEPEHFQELMIKYPIFRGFHPRLIELLHDMHLRGINAVLSTPKEERSVAITEEFVQKLKYYLKNLNKILWPSVQGPWTTICHGDFVVNNLMFNNEKVKIMDLQMFSCGSVGLDIAKYIYLSSEKDFRDKQLTGILRGYYEQFINILSQVTNISRKSLEEQGFTFDSLMMEVKKCLPYAYSICSFFIGMMMESTNESKKCLKNPIADLKCSYEIFYKLGGAAVDQRLKDLIIEIAESKLMDTISISE